MRLLCPFLLSPTEKKAMHPQLQTPNKPARQLNRRDILRGAAWSVPVIAVAAAAPTAIASANCTPQTPAAIQAGWAMTAGLANWTQTRNPSASPAVVYAGSYDGLSNVALLDADPSSSAATSSVILSRTSGCLGPGTYDFSFTAQSYIAHARDLTLTASVLNANSSVVLASTSFTTTGTLARRLTRVLRITVTQRTQVQFRYAYTFANSTVSNVGDDIGVTAPTIVRV